MAEPRETSNHPLVSNLEQQLQRHSIKHSAESTFRSKDKRRKRSSTSSNGATAETKPSSSRRRSGTTNEPITSSNTDCSHTSQRSTANSSNTSSTMSTVHYTRTGRVSKAKKGLKVHDCECGRSYTRAEHLRRHQRNHAQEGTLTCRYPDCDKSFFRPDLLQRHEERHNEVGHSSRRQSISSTEHSTHTSPTCIPTVLPPGSIGTLPPADTYPAQQALSPQPEITTFPRYNPSLFRTPQLPRTPKIAPSNPSNHAFRSSPTFISSPNDPKLQNIVSYPSRHSISGPIMVDGGMTTGGPWHDSFAPSPYSCSSGYASPIPVPEYSHIYTTPPYGPGIVRTRASSSASFVGPWAQGSQSPTSSISNLHYSWLSDEKNAIASSFPYMNASYPTVGMPMHASMDAMEHYGHFTPNDAVQLDQQEGAQLFPGEQYGTSQVAHTYPFEQYLNNYWRLFHPTFPVVHRFTFGSLEPSPMLFAAMAAIGAQYSNRTCDKRKARELHSHCVKLLHQRNESNIAGCDRLCDFQAIFLVEVFALYRARRCAKILSSCFVAMRNKLATVRSCDPSTVPRLLSFTSMSDDKVQDLWAQWTRLLSWQHLLLACYVLEFQQSTLFAREPESPLPYLNYDIPFPTHRSLWDAMTAQEWAAVSQMRPPVPKTAYEASSSLVADRYDTFQSAVLITTHYNSSGSTTFIDSGVENLLEDSRITRHQILTAKLSRLVPIRALLAVSGETWILGSKLTSPKEFSTLRNSLRAWIGQLWSCSTNDHLQTTAEALRLSIAILQLSFPEQEPFALGIGNEIGLFIAALVVWAATVAAGTIFTGSSVFTQRSHSPLVSQSNAISIRGTPPDPVISSNSSSIQLDRVPGLHHHPRSSSAMPVSLDQRSSVSHSEIVSNVSRYLHNAIEDIIAFNVSHCYTGCTNLLLWVKMHLCGVSLKEQAPATTSVVSSEDDHGELIQIVLEQIERMLGHGWEDWGI